MGRRRLAVCLVIESRDVGAPSEGEKLPQGQIVRLVLGPVEARQVDQVQVGAAEGLLREDAAVHGQDHGAAVGDAGRVAQAHHLDRGAPPAVEPELLDADEVLRQGRPGVSHERPEPLQLIAEGDRRLEGGMVRLVEFCPPGGEFGDEVAAHGGEPLFAQDRLSQALRSREVGEGEPGGEVDLSAQGAEEEFPEVEGEPLVQGHDEELLPVVLRPAQKGVDLLAKEGGQAGPFGKLGKGEPCVSDAPLSDADPPDEGEGSLVLGRLRRHMGAEERCVHEEAIAGDAAEKALIHRGHKGQADEKFGIARREIGEPRRLEGGIEKPIGGKAGAECLHRRKKPIDPFELFGPDAVQGAQLCEAHGKLGDRGQKREQPLGISRREGAALLAAPEGVEAQKGLVLGQGRAAGHLGDPAGPVVVEGKDGGEEAADARMDEVVQKVAAAVRHRNGRESAHVGIMGAEPLD